MNNRNSYWGSTVRSQRAGKYADSRTGKSRHLEAIAGEGHGIVFEDPRQTKDRRVALIPEAIPEGGCRRKSERRSEQINLGFWWMKRSYSKDNSNS